MAMSERGGTPTPASVEGAGQLLQLIRTGHARTVTQVAAAMGVARSTTLQRLEHLQHLDLVRSELRTEGSRGRPAAVLTFHPRAGVVLAAHLGLTGARAAATDLDGQVLADRFVTVDVAQGPRALLDLLQRTFDELAHEAGGTVVGLGVGTPSTFELKAYARGHGLSALDWDRDHFRDVLAEHHQVPVLLDLDVNMLALAEHRASWPDAEVLVCVKAGTLIDASVVVHGVPVRGANRLAGELGHIKVVGADDPCACGSAGCLDAVASGSALVRQMVAAGHQVDHVSQVVQRAEDGDPEAAHLVRRSGRRIGEVLSSVVNLLNPAGISMWGYLTESESLLAGVRESLYQTALPGSSEHLRLAPTSLGPLAGVRGAALSVIDAVLEPRAVEQTIRTRSWSVAGRQ
ncbi:ROK family transcriptional regulator [Pseudonocardia sp. MH-G8]|uniref:ROK family transcriptional regulator n=1 Tax=Pseudonocardia sp. MH-G8 TaxID=1854588 RepID=UPI000BA0B09B|nr:ROK family protein [Pseudonocardia sp. MH-G8]OZM79577.1 sugar kinase [Pseudonocardia sp. MH-G8]